MPSWFDLMTLDATGPEDEPGIKSASALVSFSFILIDADRNMFEIEMNLQKTDDSAWMQFLITLANSVTIVMILIP